MIIRLLEVVMSDPCNTSPGLPWQQLPCRYITLVYFPCNSVIQILQVSIYHSECSSDVLNICLQVVDKCGHLRSTHTNVTLATQPIKLQPDRATSTHVDGSTKLQHPGKSNELSSRMSTFVHSLTSSKGFFHNLADTLCKSGRFSAQRDQQCWNGHALAP